MPIVVFATAVILGVVIGRAAGTLPGLIAFGTCLAAGAVVVR